MFKKKKQEMTLLWGSLGVIAVILIGLGILIRHCLKEKPKINDGMAGSEQSRRARMPNEDGEF